MHIADILFNTAAFFVVISILVVIHELGHYSVARTFGVKIDAFSIGFGKELFGFNSKSGTRWKFCLIPMGGYVKMYGDQNAASVPDQNLLVHMTPEEKADAFHTKALYKKFLIVAAGPTANFLLAVLIFTFFFIVNGKPYALPIIDKIQENSAAFNADLIRNDEIRSIDNYPISSMRDIEKILNNSKKVELDFIIRRNNDLIKKTLKPDIVKTKDAFGNNILVKRIGITSSKFENKKLSILSSFGEAINQTHYLSNAILKSIGSMIVGSKGTEEIGGPITIAKFSGESMKNGLGATLWLIAILSINLGLINLLPIPALDGGHLLYYVIESIIRKPMNIKIQEFGFRAGIALIIFLTIFSTFNDIKKLFIN